MLLLPLIVVIGTVVGNVADANKMEQQPWKFGGIILNRIGCRQKCDSNSPSPSRFWNCDKCTSYQRNETRMDYQTSASYVANNDSESNICQRQNKFVSCTQNTTVISQAGIFGCIRLCVPDPNPYIQSNIENWTCGECETNIETTFDATRESSSLYNEERELLNNAPSAAPTDPPTQTPIRNFSPTRTPTRKPTQAVPIATTFDLPTQAPKRRSPTRRPTKTPIRRFPTQAPTRRPTQDVPISTTIETKAPVSNSETNRCKRLGLYEECSQGGTKIHRVFRQNRVTGVQRCRSTCVTVDLRPYFSTLNYPGGSPWHCGGCPDNSKSGTNTTSSIVSSIQNILQTYLSKHNNTNISFSYNISLNNLLNPSKSKRNTTTTATRPSNNNTTTSSTSSSSFSYNISLNNLLKPFKKTRSNAPSRSSNPAVSTPSSSSFKVSLNNLLSSFQSRYNNKNRHGK